MLFSTAHMPTTVPVGPRRGPPDWTAAQRVLDETYQQLVGHDGQLDLTPADRQAQVDRAHEAWLGTARQDFQGI
eukprot:2106854-Pyramimonas_sp.AAC.1